MTRPSLDQTYIEMAQVLAKRAACTRRQVGALVVDKDGRIASSGWNGTPAGELNCTDGGCPRGLLSTDECVPYSSYENCNAAHGEINALLRAGEKARNATLYCTDTPCHNCSIVIKAAGITRVVTPLDLED